MASTLRRKYFNSKSSQESSASVNPITHYVVHYVRFNSELRLLLSQLNCKTHGKKKETI